MTDKNNPFSPPQHEQTNNSSQPQNCPACGGPLERGDLHSNGNIYWQHDAMGTMKRLMTGGKRLTGSKSGLGCTIPGYHCPACNLFLMDQD